MSRNWMRTGPACGLALALGACGGGDEKPADGGVAEPTHACAGELNATTATSFYQAARCLFEGPLAPQTGVETDTIDEARVAIVRGVVRDAAGSSLAGVRVTVARHPEYGETLTDKEGEYALAVNGGEALTLRFKAEGLLPVQRQRLIEWQTFAVFPTVVLLPESDVVSKVDLSAAVTPVLAEGGEVQDDSGVRQQAVLIHPGTAVTLHLPDGSNETLDKFHLRTTEYTIGEQGPSAMPGTLPSASGYTYATEFSIDEAREAGATRVVFDLPVVTYVDNFLGFPAGTTVPAGYYDARREVTLWKEWRGSVGALNAGPLGLGGWTLDAHHLYDPRGRVLHFGSGGQRSAEGLGTFVTTIAGTGEEGSSGDGGPAVDATLAQPHGVVVAADGTALFSDDLHHIVRQITPDGTVTTIAGTGAADFSGDDGPAKKATLNKPMGLALGRDGTLFIADAGNARLRAIGPDGRIRTVAGGGKTVVEHEPVLALDAEFLEVHAVTASPDGTVYLADDVDHKVYRLGTDGLITRLAGGGTTSEDGDLAADVRLRSPLGLALGPTGDLYIAEFDAHRISRIDPSGRYWTVAGTGSAGFSGDRGPAVLAELRNPHTVDVAPDGSLYVTRPSRLSISSTTRGAAS